MTPIMNYEARVAADPKGERRDALGRRLWIPRDKMLELYNQRKTDIEIAKTLQCAPSNVGRWRRSQNPPLPAIRNYKDGRRRHRPVYKYDRTLAYELLVTRGIKDSKYVAERLGCPIDMVYTLRGEFGIARNNLKGLDPLEERLEKARVMLDEEGASYAEVGRTLRLGGDTLRRHFPGRGWTRSRPLGTHLRFAGVSTESIRRSRRRTRRSIG